MCQAAYDAHAAEYARLLDPTLAGAVERLVELAGARPGMCLLDLATGTGTVARAAARRGASVVAVDVSPGMIRIARRLSAGIEFLRADAEALPFEAGEFDAVTCGLSLSHFRHLGDALHEVLRVLRGQGRFVASTWGEGSSIPTRPVSEILERYGPAAALDEETWLRVKTGSEVLRRAGFESVSATTEHFSGRFADIEDALAWSLAWPVGAARLARLDRRTRDSFFAEAREALADRDLSWRFAFNFYIGLRPAPRGLKRLPISPGSVTPRCWYSREATARVGLRALQEIIGARIGGTPIERAARRTTRAAQRR